jgi:phosphoribosylformylglycinamidine synthase
MRIAIVQFPGSNCERETRLAVKRAGMEPVDFLWNESRDKLAEMDGFIIVGGFSYEDRSRAGIIAALDPVMQEIKLQAETGKPVLGICNGAQVLVETGLVPGLENNKLGMALTENKRVLNGKILGTGYYNDWIYMRVSDHYQRNAFTRYLTPENILHIPIAHGEGRFVMTDVMLSEIQRHGLNVFQYCDVAGNVVDTFPVNPNGSINNIAAVSNKAGNVMAIMPHPERTQAGDAIFKSMHDYIAKKHYVKVAPLDYYPRREDLKAYVPKANVHTCIVELVITDNQAMTVQNTLQQIDLPVKVKRQIHWEIECDAETLKQVLASGVLFNDRKERVIARSPQGEVAIQAESGSPRLLRRLAMTEAILVTAKEDLIGQQKLQTLQDHFNITGVKNIRHSIIWQFEGADTDFLNQLLQTNIIANPYVHDCYTFIAGK